MKFKVIFKGEIIEGMEKASVRSSFAQRFKMTDEKAIIFFSKQTITLKSDLSIDATRQLRKICHSLGMITYAEKIPSPPSQPPENLHVDNKNINKTLSLAPPGTAVLEPNERREPQKLHVNIEHLEIMDLNSQDNINIEIESRLDEIETQHLSVEK